MLVLPLSDSNLKWTSSIMITLVRTICLNFLFLRRRVKVHSAGRRASWDLERTSWVKSESESKWITLFNNREMRKWDKKKTSSDRVWQRTIYRGPNSSTWAWSCDLPLSFPCGSPNTCDKLQEVRLHWSFCARLRGWGLRKTRGEETGWREGFFFKGRGEEKAGIMLCSQDRDWRPIWVYLRPHHSNVTHLPNRTRKYSWEPTSWEQIFPHNVQKFLLQDAAQPLCNDGLVFQSLVKNRSDMLQTACAKEGRNKPLPLSGKSTKG